MDTSHQLRAALAPESIAVIGASDREASRGAPLWKNLISAGFSGRIYPVNPKYRYLGDIPCYPSIKAIEDHIDLAILAVPTKTIESVLEDIASHGTRWIALAPSDTSVTSDSNWQAKIVNKAHALGLRLIGTDCLGIMRPSMNLNASYWSELPLAGNVGFAAQSGVIGTSLLATKRIRDIGFSTLINTGDEIDVSMSEIVDFLAQDKETGVIVLHIEGIRNPREFFSAVREAAKHKPVIVLRGGKSLQASQLLASRMGVPAGDDKVFNALLERAGAIRVYGLEEMLSAIEIFGQKRLPRSNRVGIISNGSGFGVLAADAASECDVKIATLSRTTTEKLHKIFDNPLPMTNPVDLWADADPRRIKLAVDALNKDENVDAIIIVTAPTFAAPLERVCDAIAYATDASYKPIITAWIGESQTIAAKKRLKDHPITVLKSPESAIKAFSWMAHYAQSRRYLAATIASESDPLPADERAIRNILEENKSNECYSLNELQTKKLLACLGLTAATGILVQSPIEAVNAAKNLGFPVVIKAIAKGVIHKSNVGGVALDLKTEEDVLKASQSILESVKNRAPYAQLEGLYIQRYIRQPHGREVKITVHTDSRFGPVISFGAGGHMGDIYKDDVCELLPLTKPLAGALLEKPTVSTYLGDFRGMPAANKEALAQILMRISKLVTDFPLIRDLTIDPLLVDEGGCIVLDAHIGISPNNLDKDALASHLTLAPEPSIDSAWRDIKGGQVSLRSIHAQDYDSLRDFLKRLSPQTTYLRLHISSNELAREKLIELTNIDYNREVAIVACDTEEPDLIHGVARFKRMPGTSFAEFGVVVEDEWQRRGLASLLMKELIEQAKIMKLTVLIGYVLRGNDGMFALMDSLGFVRHEDETLDDAFVVYTLNLE